MPNLLSGLRSTLLSALTATLLISTSLPVFALPDGSDPITRFIQEKMSAGAAATTAVTETTSGLIDGVRETASNLVVSAMNFLGVRYRFGGTSEETGFDCSGFTRHVFENSLGLLLPRRAVEQAQAPGLLTIRQEDLKPGDLVFFNTMRRTFSHVGIYLGDGKFIHAPRTGSTIRVDNMDQDYWKQRFDGARRAPQLSAGSTGLNTLRQGDTTSTMAAQPR